MTAPATARVYLVNATPCSAGTGPGYATLPWEEAAVLVAAGYAVRGGQPPPNSGGSDGPVTPP
jgi:hypothetical protein